MVPKIGLGWYRKWGINKLSIYKLSIIGNRVSIKKILFALIGWLVCKTLYTSFLQTTIKKVRVGTTDLERINKQDIHIKTRYTEGEIHLSNQSKQINETIS